ncbi:hypothetical protein LRS74_00365 [Streptomyces sp. LX-29]|uniref:hypothetical protein n=1 Tax=Streptomyces sp. LX-29 TaxID=2900152 RepID=UPI00240D2358|nr:hypothetical protein [Streptomyces sp. LX-29]WFB05637.1 hypothetical protein LRS74_00365 [Streptomyces sp. LX-29]
MSSDVLHDQLNTAPDLEVRDSLEGRSVATLAREHGVSRGAIRTAVADLMPDHTAIEEDAPASELPATVDTPGKVADFPLEGKVESSAGMPARPAGEHDRPLVQAFSLLLRSPPRVEAMCALIDTIRP